MSPEAVVLPLLSLLLFAVLLILLFLHLKSKKSLTFSDNKNGDLRKQISQKENDTKKSEAGKNIAVQQLADYTARFQAIVDIEAERFRVCRICRKRLQNDLTSCFIKRPESYAKFDTPLTPKRKRASPEMP